MLGKTGYSPLRVVVRPCRLWRVLSTCHMVSSQWDWRKISHAQRCDVYGQTGLTPMTSKSSSILPFSSYMGMCSLKKEIKNIMTVTSEVRTRLSSSPGPSNSFTWPKRKDVCWISYMNVICKIQPSTTTAWKKSKYRVISGFPVFLYSVQIQKNTVQK